MRRPIRWPAAALLTAPALLCVPAPARAGGAITIDFVRHGEAGDHVDAIFASGMTRAVQTADPLADALGLPITQLARARRDRRRNFRRHAGRCRRAADRGGAGYSDAVQQIYHSTVADHTGADAVFSHEGSIAFRTLMNVRNPDVPLLVELALTKGEFLPYTGIVEVRGSPEDGWTLVSWDGHPVPADPGLPTELLVGVRDLIVAPQTAAYHLLEAGLTGQSAPAPRCRRPGRADQPDPAPLTKSPASATTGRTDRGRAR